MKIFSFDAETNGLWGQAFAIAAVLWDTESGSIKEWAGRCPINGEINAWVTENVLPKMTEIPENYKDYAAMLRGFVEFYMANKENAVILVHVGLPVEARLFLDAHNMGILGDWDAPFPLVDCSAIPAIGTSVDTYNAENGIEMPTFAGGVHNPLYDSYSAMYAYFHAISNYKPKR